MDRNESAFRFGFRQTLAGARQLVRDSLPTGDPELRRLLSFVLRNQTPSDYPYVLKYAFCRRESDAKKILKISAAVHLLQQSSFITDDIFDNGELRYGALPVYLEYDVSRAIIAAELLQGVALRCISEEVAGSDFCNVAAALKLLNQILLDGYVSQFLDISNSGRTVKLRDYYRMIALGAGRAFRNVACSGALLAGKPEEETRILGDFAYTYGMALFIIDDIIDILPARLSGKTYAGDLKGRRMRLPLLMALRTANRSQRQLLNRFLNGETPRRPTIRQAAGAIRDCGALRASQGIARRYLNTALGRLSGLPCSITTERLRWLATRLLPLV